MERGNAEITEPNWRLKEDCVGYKIQKKITQNKSDEVTQETSLHQPRERNCSSECSGEKIFFFY